MLKGSLVALITPMNNDKSIDFDSLENLIKWHIKEGTDAIVSVGTTGESTTLSFEEHNKVIKFTVDIVKKRIPIIAGTGSNNTQEAIFLTKHAKQVGADMCLSVVPYYNKPNQRGIIEHFKTIAHEVNIPLILYNVPSRTIIDMNNDTVLELSKIKNIVGIKESTGNIARICELVEKAPKKFLLYSGDDSTAMGFILCGGHGAISVSANVAPKIFSKMCKSAINGNIELAKNYNNKLQLLHKELFCEPSPAPTKWALYKLGKCNPTCRLPIVNLSLEGQNKVLNAMKLANLF